MPRTTVVIRLQIEAMHNWAACPYADVAFLKHPHRHIFFIECEKEVSHDDRDIELIRWRQTIKLHVEGNMLRVGDYGIPEWNLQINSCESIATALANEFQLCRCSVFEDNENGATYTA